MKTLYVSDLDGTLINSQKLVTLYSSNVINKVISDGGLFSIATARSVHTIYNIVQDINFSVPIILMNGVFLYDILKAQYVRVNGFRADVIPTIVNIFAKHNTFPFMYEYLDSKMKVYYRNLEKDSDLKYYLERKDFQYKTFEQTDDYKKSSHKKQIVYFGMFGDYITIKPLYDDLKKVEHINCVMYEDLYESSYLLEIFSDTASKSNAVNYLKEIVGADEVVAFGDNYNDIDMLLYADRSYTPVNGIDEAKRCATAVINSCNHNGVAKFIKDDFYSQCLPDRFVSSPL